MSYGARADAALNAFSSRLQQVPMAMPQMCVAAWLKTKTPLRQVCCVYENLDMCLCAAVCVGLAPEAARLEELHRVLTTTYIVCVETDFSSTAHPRVPVHLE